MKFSEKVVTLAHAPKGKERLTPITVRFVDDMITESYSIPGLGRFTRYSNGEWFAINDDGETKELGNDLKVPFKFEPLEIKLTHLIEGTVAYLRSYEIGENYEVYSYQACTETFVDFMFFAGEWTAEVRIGKDVLAPKEDLLKILWGKEFWQHNADENSWYYIAKAEVPEEELPYIMLRYLSTVSDYN